MLYAAYFNQYMVNESLKFCLLSKLISRILRYAEAVGKSKDIIEIGEYVVVRQ